MIPVVKEVVPQEREAEDEVRLKIRCSCGATSQDQSPLWCSRGRKHQNRMRIECVWGKRHQNRERVWSSRG
jgi:hypothetical protein